MKLLIDENISYRIVKLLEEQFPGAIHINQVDQQRMTDQQIWDYAKKEGFIIVTYDEDFNDLQTLLGFPPKVIWLRFGNATTKMIASKIMENNTNIKELSTENEIGLLEIY